MSTVLNDTKSEAKNRFQLLFNLLENRLNGQKDKPFHQIRKKALEKITHVDFPDTRSEDWKYTPLGWALKPKYNLTARAHVLDKLPALPGAEAESYRLVFLNGNWMPEWSTKGEVEPGFSIYSADEAMENPQLHAFLTEAADHWLDHAKDPFAPMSLAYSQQPVCLHLQKKTAVSKPLHILHLYSEEQEPIFSASALLVLAERESSLTLLESFHPISPSKERNHFITCSHFYRLEQQSNITTLKLQELNASDFMVHNTCAEQHRDSTFTAFTADLGGKMVRNNVSALHKEENVLTNLYGVFMGTKDQHIDNQTYIDHAQAHCQSNEWYKGILTDQSRGVFNGKIMVRQDAQKINAFQQNNALVLSENARMDSKPQLEIFADDVKCSHGATIGQLDESAIFYLRSRGLNLKEAKAMLQLAFVQEVTHFIENTTFKELMEQRISNKFNQ
jgi:Fe-S cluster assembly protein SufD